MGRRTETHQFARKPKGTENVNKCDIGVFPIQDTCIKRLCRAKLPAMTPTNNRPWLWGQVRWWVIGAPWERLPVLCALCGQYHGASVQSRLAHCPAWSESWDTWRRCWTNWTHYACQWQVTATSHERWLCARLLIPLSLINTIPHTERHKLRAEVGLFQFRMI